MSEQKPTVVASLYPYEHRCWCGTSWTVYEQNAADHEQDVQRHREEHRKDRKR